MKKTMRSLALGLALSSLGQVAKADDAIKCSSCEEWNRPARPFQIYGNAYYVGTAGLSATDMRVGDAFGKAAAKTAQSNPFIDPEGCRKLAAGARKNFEARLQREAAEKAKAAGG